MAWYFSTGKCQYTYNINTVAPNCASVGEMDIEKNRISTIMSLYYGKNSIFSTLSKLSIIFHSEVNETSLPYHLVGERVSPDFNIRDEMGGKVVRKCKMFYVRVSKVLIFGRDGSNTCPIPDRALKLSKIIKILVFLTMVFTWYS